MCNKITTAQTNGEKENNYRENDNIPWHLLTPYMHMCSEATIKARAEWTDLGLILLLV